MPAEDHSGVNAKSHAFAEKLQTQKDNNNVFEPGVAVRLVPDGVDADSQRMAASTPAKYYAPNRHVADEVEDLNYLVQEQGAQLVTKPSKLLLEERRRQRDAMARAQFDEWVTSSFNLTDPKDVRLLNEMYPQYLAEREVVWEERIGALRKFVELDFYGPRNLDDMILQYSIQNGEIEVPTIAINYILDRVTNAGDQLSAEDLTTRAVTHMNRGLLNKNSGKDLRSIAPFKKRVEATEGRLGPGFLYQQSASPLPKQANRAFVQSSGASNNPGREFYPLNYFQPRSRGLPPVPARANNNNNDPR